MALDAQRAQVMARGAAASTGGPESGNDPAGQPKQVMGSRPPDATHPQQQLVRPFSQLSTRQAEAQVSPESIAGRTDIPGHDQGPARIADNAQALQSSPHPVDVKSRHTAHFDSPAATSAAGTNFAQRSTATSHKPTPLDFAVPWVRVPPAASSAPDLGRPTAPLPARDNHLTQQNTPHGQYIGQSANQSGSNASPYYMPPTIGHPFQEAMTIDAMTIDGNARRMLSHAYERGTLPGDAPWLVPAVPAPEHARPGPYYGHPPTHPQQIRHLDPGLANAQSHRAIMPAGSQVVTSSDPNVQVTHRIPPDHPNTVAQSAQYGYQNVPYPAPPVQQPPRGHAANISSSGFGPARRQNGAAGVRTLCPPDCTDCVNDAGDRA